MRLLFLAVLGAAEEIAVRLEREHEAERIGDDQEHREADAELVCERRLGRGVRAADRRRDRERDRREEQQPGLEPRRAAVELLHVVLQAAEQERSAEHEQRVRHDRAGDRRLDEHVLPCAERRERDHELGQVAERRVQQAADRVAGLGRDRLGREAQQRGERHDREDR